MLPTRLTVWLFVLGLVPLAGAAADYLIRGPEAAVTSWLVRLFVLAYDAGLVCLLLLDAFLARRALRRLRVRRERPARLSVGVENEMSVVAENLTGARQRVLLRDQPPPAFPAEPALLTAVLPAHGWARLPYRLVPTDRGNFSFGDLHARCRGPLGLAWCDRTFEAAEAVQVFPNLLEVRRYESLVRTTLIRTGGYHVKRMPGAGREFSHFRDYTVDDDYRFINWKATARRAKPITSVFESEHSQDVIFCLDVGRMMAARVGGLSKLDHAINAVLMLTHVSHRFQDNLGLLVFSHTVHLYLPPAKGRAQHARFLQALYTVKPELVYVNYKDAFQYLVAQHPKRALTMVFTDLLDTVVSSEYRDAVQLLRRFHLPLTLAVADVPLRELAARTPNTVEELYDIQVSRSLLHDRAELLRSLERAGVMVVDTVPERLTVDAVNRYLALKTGAKV
jgi:uncharacterized protein (DUF58 family)